MIRIKKYLIELSLVLSLVLCGFTVYASDTRFTDTAEIKSAPAVKTAKTADTTTGQSITFEKDEYVRITQPIKTDSVTSTFDSQINIMGEAREGTKIVITVSLDAEEMVEAKTLPTKYELSVVGATQTFNQLIDLSEGLNCIVISYTNVNTKDIYGEMTITIKRENENTKKAMQNYIVNPKVILDKVGK